MPAAEQNGAWRPAADDGEPALEQVDLKELLATLRRRWKLVLAITLASVGTAWYLAKSQPARYVAVATIRLQDTHRQVTGGIDEPVGQGYVGTGYWSDPIQSQLQVLDSRAVATQVVLQHPLGLRVIPIGVGLRSITSLAVVSEPVADSIHLAFNASGVVAKMRGAEVKAPYDSLITIGGLAFTVKNNPGVSEGALVSRSVSRAAIDLSGALNAKQRKMTDVVDVEYVGDDPFEAQQIVNGVVQVFHDVSAQTAQAQSRRRREFLGAQLIQSDSALAVAQQNLSDFRSREHLYGSTEQITAQQTQLLSIDEKRQEMASDRDVYQRLLATLQKPLNDSVSKTLRTIISSPSIATNPMVASLYQQLMSFELMRDSLTAGEWGSAATNPDVQRANAMIEGTQQRLISAIQSHVASLNERIATMDVQRAANSGALDAMPAKQAMEARLMTRVETAKRMSDQLRDDYQRARVSEAVEAGQVEIVDLAVRPGRPMGARMRTKLGLGLILGLFFGAGASLLVERLNTSIRRREEIEKLLQVPGLGIIPQILPNGLVRGRLRIGGMNVPFPQSAKALRRKGSDSAALVTANNMRSTSAEAFRTLRTNLIFSQAVQSLRTIVVTSPSPQDGKTTTATNLAVTFAQQGLKVLLADCDLRRGRLHNVFRVAREPGMTQLLAGQNKAAEVIQPSGVPGMSFISAGTFPPNPSELLGSARTKQILAELGTQFDIIILDTPPVHVAGDALILGTIADGVILVLRAGNTERAAAQHAMTRLSNVGARVVGAVLNDPDHKVPQYGGYYYYDYYYGDEGRGS